MINETVKVLDRGYVKYLGSTVIDGRTLDQIVVDSARISYLSTSDEGARDKKLINYLMKNRHTSPFEQVTLSFEIKAPLFVVRQWMRHRTWSYNEVSRRYTSVDVDFYTPQQWRKQARDNRQASVNEYVSSDALESSVFAWVSENYLESVFYDDNDMPVTKSIAENVSMMLFGLYESLLEAGVAREQARMLLPQNMYTTFRASVDAHNLMNFIRLRASEHAQFEMRQYAMVLDSMLAELMPITHEAFRANETESE